VYEGVIGNMGKIKLNSTGATWTVPELIDQGKNDLKGKLDHSSPSNDGFIMRRVAC
jgi:hypothetical protein